MKKTIIQFDWENGYYKVRTLSRTFATLEEAERFSRNKEVTDIYCVGGGKYKVEWIKREEIYRDDYSIPAQG